MEAANEAAQVEDTAPGECCGRCIFYGPVNAEQGICRRFPPQLMFVALVAPPKNEVLTPNGKGAPPQISYNAQPSLVPVVAGGWCGEFEDVQAPDEETH